VDAMKRNGEAATLNTVRIAAGRRGGGAPRRPQLHPARLSNRQRRPSIPRAWRADRNGLLWPI